MHTVYVFFFLFLFLFLLCIVGGEDNAHTHIQTHTLHTGFSRSSNSCGTLYWLSFSLDELNVMGFRLYSTLVGQIQYEFPMRLSKKGAAESNSHPMKFTSNRKESRKWPTTTRTARKPCKKNVGFFCLRACGVSKFTQDAGGFISSSWRIRSAFRSSSFFCFKLFGLEFVLHPHTQTYVHTHTIG